MNVFIVGSNRQLERNDPTVERFNSFCRSLGMALARERWHVAIGSVNAETADYHVLCGMDQAGSGEEAVPVDLYRNEPVVHKFRLQIKQHTGFSNMTAAHVTAVSRADVVIAVGGTNKTPGAIWAAVALKKPVVAVQQYGGASAKVWTEMHALYERDLKDDDTFNTLAAGLANCEGDDSLCRSVLKASRRLVEETKRRAFSRLETIAYSLAAGVFGGAGLLAATLGHVQWRWAVTIVVLGVVAGWLLDHLRTGEKEKMVSTFPDAVMLCLVILVGILLGGQLFSDVVKEGLGDKANPRIFFALFGAALLSGYTVRTALPKYLQNLFQQTGVPNAE